MLVVNKLEKDGVVVSLRNFFSVGFYQFSKLKNITNNLTIFRSRKKNITGNQYIWEVNFGAYYSQFDFSYSLDLLKEIEKLCHQIKKDLKKNTNDLNQVKEILKIERTVCQALIILDQFPDYECLYNSAQECIEECLADKFSLDNYQRPISFLESEHIHWLFLEASHQVGGGENS